MKVLFVFQLKSALVIFYCLKEEIPHEKFESIEEINNYLLEHPEVRNFITSRAKGGNSGLALFLMFDKKTEELAKGLGLEIMFPTAEMRMFMDNKVNTNRIAEKAEVPCVPNVLSPIFDYNHLREISSKLGSNLVVQTPYGDSGHTTYFISNESDFDKHKDEIVKEEEVKIMKQFNSRLLALSL